MSLATENICMSGSACEQFILLLLCGCGSQHSNAKLSQLRVMCAWQAGQLLGMYWANGSWKLSAVHTQNTDVVIMEW